jgi:hypothetical protein
LIFSSDVKADTLTPTLEPRKPTAVGFELQTVMMTD